ncbi:serine/threonine protein kinase [Leptospira langatensis]|uniref:Serine/threonine protein kinase n=1 Tax=Leptospira langatensis TaxID=2484983 RepID=A0A5F1ZTK1_9LEPT|nr:serine/threonine protein kinase [Leptospira langatensis]TGK02626.1 serine/threonine protein kinase [Leptospira langatensis]TGL40172.1 serine/threonine protein kinase [Leptospira langatensis]
MPTSIHPLSISISPVDTNQNAILYVPNTDGTQVPAKDYFTLKILNNGDHPASLKGGDPVSDSQTSGGPALFIIYLPDSISFESLSSVRLDPASGWKLKSFSDDGVYLAVSPASDTIVPVGGTISISFIGFTSIPRQIPQRLSVNVFNVDISMIGTGEYDFNVFVQQVPKQGNKDLILESRTTDSNIVYVTSDSDPANSENDLNFYLVSSGRSSNAIPAKANQTYLRISFDTGKEMGDVAEATDLEAIILGIVRAYKNNFSSSFERIGKIPSWKFTAATDIFLNGGSDDRIEFGIEKLVTHLSPGIAKVYIEYYNIPGYNDGYSDFTLTKEYPEAVISGFFSSDYSIIGGNSILLQWETEGTSYCTLEASTGNLLDENGQTIPAFQSFPTFQSGVKVTPVPISPPPASGGIIFSISLHAFSLDGRSSSREIGIQVLPVSCSLSASNLDPVPPGTAVTLSWTSQNARSISLDQGIGDVKQQGQISVSPRNTTRYTLTAIGLQTVTSSVVITVDVLFINYFRPDASVVGIGEPVQISWDIAFAVSVTLNGSPVSASGSMSFSINVYCQTFTLVCQGKNGQSLTQSFDVYGSGAM